MRVRFTLRVPGAGHLAPALAPDDANDLCSTDVEEASGALVMTGTGSPSTVRRTLEDVLATLAAAVDAENAATTPDERTP